MIAVNQLSIHYTGNPVFEDVSFVIGDRDRIGLVGKNGAGKTTLLKILSGLLTPDTGEIIYSQDTTIGYLPQEMVITSDKTVLGEAMTAFDKILSLQAEADQLLGEISSREDYESVEYNRLLHRLEELNTHIHTLGGANLESDAARVLNGLGFRNSDLHRSMNEFSSGWKMRVELAKILLQNPSVILLDEPTNHLDIEAIAWLEEWISGYRGALVLVSHDRAFLDNVTNRTIEISLGKIFDFKCSYSEYVVQRQEQLEQQMAAFENQQRQIAQIERFIERFRYKATKARQVQSRIKMLEKMDKVEVESFDRSAIAFRFPPAPHSGKVVLEIKSLSKSYGDFPVLQNIHFTLLKGEKVAFVGRNGEGKTTLARIIAAGLDYEGILNLGHNVSIGYYAQNQTDLLDLEKTVFETLDEIARGEVRTRLKAILGAFLFRGEDIDKKVKVLSGGEKARLALARLLLEPVNLLVLDEPTNHLDMLSKDILKTALLDYSGALIIVSHDRDFLQGLTTRVVEFRDRSIKEYLGDVYDFLEARKLTSLQELEKLRDSRRVREMDDQALGKLSYEKKKAFEREKRKIAAQISKCEESIEKAEQEIAAMDQKLAAPQQYQDVITSKDFFDRYNYLKNKVNHLLEEWEQLHAALEQLEASESA
ncbi:MAG: ABC-F family ATP-binding cassette domain-containing protein [Bacteroidales bacterium]|jgi:ATP-binding cassette subfamily F protein 3|nr:ABC-F family ATP-binding cassette domain-containing protein [Bacteroidales bacterium]NPV36033.1 ABC-F family ATP-binding cassette domain-containing protein [Bacteroidales bacterium]